MNRTHINLLTWRFRFYLIVRARLLQWVVVWSIVGVIAVATWQIKSRRLNAAADNLALMESRCAPLKSMQVENQRMAARLAELHSHQSLLARLDDEQVPFRLLGLVSHGVRQCSGSVSVRTMTFNRSRREVSLPMPQPASRGKAAKQPKEHEEIIILQLNGVADDTLAISRFVAALRDSGVFAAVDLKSSVGAREAQGRAQSFLVECTLEFADQAPTTARARPYPVTRW